MSAFLSHDGSKGALPLFAHIPSIQVLEEVYYPSCQTPFTGKVEFVYIERQLKFLLQSLNEFSTSLQTFFGGYMGDVSVLLDSFLPFPHKLLQFVT